jgi:hypothetical protein
MGGQACVFYGAAEFSRDTDLAILAEADNLSRLSTALQDLQAEVIAVPPFQPHWLDLGLAVHFRCGHAEAQGMRIDVMSKMRGVDDFARLWPRRTTIDVEGLMIDLMSLGDLVLAKKTQRAKDWPMIARLVEANYFAHASKPSPEQIDFWLCELRTPGLLIDLSQANLERCRSLEPRRPLLAYAYLQDAPALRAALRDEEDREREADRA